MKARRVGRKNRRGDHGWGSGWSEAGVSSSALDALSGFGGPFHETEDDVVRRLMDRIHRGHPLRGIRL